MAKGNLLLGTAGNSVGDVVMYRREGAQVSRVRVRKVKNPKTSAQCLQRSAFAPAAKFYSPLAIVLEKSFEGLSKSKSYSKFLKNAVEDARANDWLLPKGTGFFPLPYQLSQGSLPQISYVFDAVNTTNLFVSSLILANTPANMGALSSAFVDAGYQNGDIVTIIACLHSDISEVYDDTFPIAIQFAIDTTSTATVDDTFGNKLSFIVEEGGSFIMGKEGFILAAAAIIVARFENDKWRRSTQNLAVVAALLTQIGTDAYKKAAIASYGATDADGNPLVYLDGKDTE